MLPRTPAARPQGYRAAGSCRWCTPDGIRTRATALRGRRARPLHNGGLFRAHRADATLSAAPRESQIVVLAGVLGLEPRLTGPEPVGLPITPYPMGSAHPENLWASGRTEGQRYTNASAATNRGGVTYAAWATGGAVLLRSPILRATNSTSTRKTPFCVIVSGSCHQDASETLRVLSSWLRAIA